MYMLGVTVKKQGFPYFAQTAWLYFARTAWLLHERCRVAQTALKCAAKVRKIFRLMILFRFGLSFLP